VVAGIEIFSTLMTSHVRFASKADTRCPLYPQQPTLPIFSRKLGISQNPAGAKPHLRPHLGHRFNKALPMTAGVVPLQPRGGAR
jgi:hypothetical protein